MSFDNNRGLDMESMVKEIKNLRLQVEAQKVELDGVGYNEKLSKIADDEGFDAMGKVPDLIKHIPSFDGNPTRLVQWISDVDGTIELFQKFKGTNKYKVILRTIRRKIVGDADEILITNNTLLSWQRIRETLTRAYSDNRDLMTLDVQLHALTKKNDTIETFYGKIKEIHLLIANVVRLDPNYSESETPTIIRMFGEICMTTFIRGIGNPMSSFLKVLKPRNLTQAFEYALEYQNSEFRSNINLPRTIPSYANDNHIEKYQHQMRIPQQRNPPRYQNNNHQNYHQNHHHNTHQNNYQNNFQNNNLRKNQPDPEPMDVDRSMRSRMMTHQKRAERQNVTRKVQDTRSWQAQAPPFKRMANVAQIKPDTKLEKYLYKTTEETNTDKNICMCLMGNLIT